MASLYTTTLLVVNPPINIVSRPYYSSHRHKSQQNSDDELRKRQLDTTNRYLERRYGELLNCSLHMTMKVGSLDVLILQPPVWSFDATCDLITCIYKILWHGSIGEDRESVQLRILLNNVGGFCVLDMSQDDEEEDEEELEEDEDEGYVSDSSSGGGQESRDDGKNEDFEKLYMTSENPRTTIRHAHEVDSLAHDMATKLPAHSVSPSSPVSSPPATPLTKRRPGILTTSFDPNDRNWEVVTAGYQETRHVKDILSFLQCTCPLAPAIPSMILPMGKSSSEKVHDILHEEDENDEDTDSINSSKASSLASFVGRVPSYNGYCGQYRIVAVGGTFDHLHWGHKILLTMAGFLTNYQLIVGITGPDLLKNKEYASELESLKTRKARVREYLKYTFPQLASVRLVTIEDVYGPTATEGDIEALVVSAETRRGGQAINSERIKNKLNPLAVYEINILGGDAKDQWKDKISSTDIRKRIYQAKHQKTSDDAPE